MNFDDGWNINVQPWSTVTLLRSSYMPMFDFALSAVGELRSIFHPTAPDALKIKLLKSAIETIDAYALESLPINPTTSDMLDAGHRRIIRAAFGVNWQNNITNDKAYS